MMSDEEEAALKKRVATAIRAHLSSIPDLSSVQVTVGSIRRAVESALGVDLTNNKARKSFVKETIVDAISRPQGETSAVVKSERDNGSGMHENEEEEDEYVCVGDAKDAQQKKKKKKAKKNKKRKLLILSWQLAEFMGVDECGRGEVTKKLWAYIKEKGLQHPNDGRKIVLDDTLQKIFKRKTVTMFTMNKYLTPHMKRRDEIAGYQDDSEDNDGEEDEEEEVPKRAKKRKASPNKKKKKKKKRRAVDPEAGRGKGSGLLRASHILWPHL